ncbi:MAG: S8 family serine peptidase [Pseudomonadota bacterium]
MLRHVVVLMAVVLGAFGCARGPTPTAPDAIALADARSLEPGVAVIVSVRLEAAGDADARGRDIAARHGGTLLTGWPLASVGLYCIVLQPPEGEAADSYLARLAQDADLVTASPVGGFETLAAPAYADEFVPVQHGLHAVNALVTHERFTGEGVDVAVIDTGVAPDHPDLVDRIAVWRDFVGAADATPIGEAHGTAVAAVIAADGRNETGIVGVAPNARIAALRACWEEEGTGRCNTFSIARALNFAIGAGAEVINLSLAGEPDPLIAALLDRAAWGGTVVVAAHGDAAEPRFPAAHPVTISAFAHGRAGAPAGIGAPGTDVISARPVGGYDFFSGDSIAAAHVSGVTALLKQARPSIDAAGARASLQASGRGVAPPIVLDSCRAVAVSEGRDCLWPQARDADGL